MIRSICFLIGLLALGWRAQAATNNPALAGVASFEAACHAWDARQFASAAAKFREAITNEPTNVTNHYWLGVAEFHRMLHLREQPTNAAAAAIAMNQTIAALEHALVLAPGYSECHALLGTTYGMKIDGSLLRALRFGPKVSSHRSKALESGAANPRVQFLLGMCLFHTARKPAAWRDALDTLTKAEALFTAEEKISPKPLEPRWGHATCLAFIGQTHECLSEMDKAAEFYRKALKLHPKHHIAEDGLKRVGSGKEK